MRDTFAVKDVALKNLRHHKGRTLLTMGTTALSVALIFVVLTYFHSDDHRNKRAAINEIGAYHVQYEHLTAKQQQQIASNPKIEKQYISYNNRNIKSSTFKKLNIDMAIGYMEGVNDGLVQLRDGRAPVADSEIVLDEWVIEELGYTPRLGQEISLDLQISINGKTENSTHTFKLVGITDDIAVRKAARAGLMFISKGFSQHYSPDPEIILFALLKSDFNAISAAQKIGKSAGLTDKQIVINERYTGAYEQNPTSILQAGLAVLVIVLSAGMVIYNIFNIYVSQQIRLFGMMKAIGMAPQQLRRMIHTEGLIISLVGSIAGVLLGFGGSVAFIPFVGNGATSGSSLYVEISPYIVGAALVSGLLLVTFSVHIPARRVGGISEIAAMRYNPAAETGKKSKKIRNRLKNSLSSLTLVSAQMLRHRKRSWVTIMSITLTGLIFVFAGSILNSMNIGNMAGSMVPGDYKLSANSSYRGTGEQLDILNRQVIRQVQSMPGVQSVMTEMYDAFIYNKEDAAAHLGSLEDLRNPYISSEIYGYDDALMQKTLKAAGQEAAVLEKMKTGNNLIAIAEEGTYRVGDKIRMAKYGEGQEEREFTIVGVIAAYITYKGDSADGGTLIAHQELFKRLGMDQRIKQLSVTVDQEHKEHYIEVEQSLRALPASDRRIEFTSFQEMYHEFSEIKQVVELAAYGFIAALLVISIFNLVNSNLTSMLSRKHEISMIEAIGLSQGQLMMQLGSEGLIVIIVSLLLTCIVGIPAGYIGVEMFKREATYAQYQFPLGSILTLTCAYFAVQVMTTLYMHRRLSKESLIERIRFSE
ncbi:FtsX-like permease family protein [Paenibacillus albidus]|uniref:ABC transporter permease n=1 Tax=Paenibacillus albidus TaxID=2041023 RepID=UPI001BE7C9DC|nr:ABC transporter permease [Paenibacillus albidus]MBT2292720.1 FtsX-like permease family protein [Paenibacillus albidus]